MRNLAALVAIAVLPGFGPAEDGPEPAAKSPPSLQPTVTAALNKVAPSVVSIWHGEGRQSNLSGIIVS